MSKRSRRSEAKVAQPATQPDARREISARAVKALRSAEAMKLRTNLLQVYNEAIHETPIPSRSGNRRPATRRSDSRTPDRLHLPSVDAMSSKSLSPQVRDELLDGTRVLSCVRRHSRKETLFALRRIGKGKSGRNIRKARWTDKSYLRCK